MPTSVDRLFSVAGVRYGGVVQWGEPIDATGPGVYVVGIRGDPGSIDGLPTCNVSFAAVGSLLARRPELTVDGLRPDEDALAGRIRAFWLPDEPVLYIGKATSLATRVGQYYATRLGARSPHAGGWFLKSLANLDELFVHFGPTDYPQEAESAMLDNFSRNVSSEARAALHDPDHPFPFANLEHPPGTRKRHGIEGARAPKSAATATRPLTVPGTAQGSRGSSTHHRTQRVTEADIRAGRIRVPSTGSTKRLFPSGKTNIVIDLRGSVRTVRWDPRYGPDKERSGVISIPRQDLEALVAPNEVLRVQLQPDGTLRLD